MLKCGKCLEKYVYCRFLKMTSHLKKLKIQQLNKITAWLRDCGYSWIFFFVYLFCIFENGFYDNQNLKDNERLFEKI